jgi:hypothetical protein
MSFKKALRKDSNHERDPKRGIFAYLNSCVSSSLAVPARLRAMTAAMALFFDKFAIPHTQNSLQIIQYSRPLKPKQTVSRSSGKEPGRFRSVQLIAVCPIVP